MLKYCAPCFGRGPARQAAVHFIGLVLGLGLLAAPHGSAAAPQQAEFSTYAEMRARGGELYREGRIAEAAEVFAIGLERFPDHLAANAYNLALMYGRLDRLADGLVVLGRPLDQGEWYGPRAFDHDEWEPYRALPGFAVILERSAARFEEARRAARPERMVATPAGYDPQQRYPLFIALHGGGGSMAEFSQSWTSPRLRAEFIVAYLQSSLLVGPNGYNWTEDAAVSAREVQAAYEQLLREYPVDPARVLLGGFSSGGVTSLELLFSATIPAAGFVVLCPPIPAGVTPATITAARDRGLRGTVITTEMDNRLEEQRALVAQFAAGGLDHRFEVTPDAGHWYPDDLAERIDRALEHALGGRP